MMSASEANASIPRGVRIHEKGAFDGYTLFAPLNGVTVYLIDMAGEVVHSWKTDSAPGGWMYLLDDGTLLRCGREDEDPQFRGGGIGGRIQKLAPDGSVLWHYQLANENRQQHHDVQPLPNGNLLVIAWERIPAGDAVGRGRDPEKVGKVGLWPDAVLEIEPTLPKGGEIVWEWHAWDHLVQDTDPKQPNYGSIPDHPELIDINADHRDQPPMTEEKRREMEKMQKQMAALGYAGGKKEETAPDGKAKKRGDVTGDWLHTNSIAYCDEFDLIVLSTPKLNELWVIDHSTTTEEAASHRGGRFDKGGDLLWRWGNPRTYGAGEDADQRLFFQHDPTWLVGKTGELRVLVFNNGRGREDGDYSSVDELVLPFDPARGFAREPGQPFGPAEPAWTYSDREHFYSGFISGAQRLPNGNTLICSGAGGRLFEATRDGRIVWDYRNPFGGEIKPPEHAGNAPPLALFRGTRLSRDHSGVRRLQK